MIIGIVAADNNWAIGKKNGLLYTLKKDMQHFKETTTGHFVICGYNTLLSFPKSRALKNRTTICLAPEGIERDDCIVVHSLEECLKLVRLISDTFKDTDFYVIGGASVYRSFLPYYDKVIVTKVDASDPEAEVFFPNLDKDPNYSLETSTERIEDENYGIYFVTYYRKNSPFYNLRFTEVDSED